MPPEDEEVQETQAQAAPEAPTQGQPAPESQEQAQPAVEPSQGTGPWAKDLEATFADEAIRTQVDGFLRQKVQPYVTQLEGQRGNEEAQQLYDRFQEDPADTYLSVTGALFGDEAAEAVQSALYEYYAEEPEGDDAESVETEESPLDPRVAKLVEREEEREQRDAYEAEVKRLKEQDPQLDENLLAPFVISADGDMDAAYEGYKNYLARLQPSQEQETETPAPPAVLGSDFQAPTTPPVQKQYGSLDEAVDEFFAEQKASAAPAVVGSV